MTESPPALGIIKMAVAQYRPRRIFALFSGGHDSVVATHLATYQCCSYRYWNWPVSEFRLCSGTLSAIRLETGNLRTSQAGRFLRANGHRSRFSWPGSTSEMLYQT